MHRLSKNGLNWKAQHSKEVAMKYIKMNATQLNVSKICMGSGNFGEKLDETEAMHLLDVFSDAGGNFIDTANVYCR